MGARYLTDLADVLRAAGLTVREVSGWERRARGTGGYAEGAPSSIMLHHTASKPATDGPNDVSYIISGSSVAPIANLYTDRKGVIWVCAAGATNTNGTGTDTWGGGVPANRMNEYAIGNEIANDGIGEPYPLVQQDAVLRSTIAICDHYGIPTNNVRGHFEWTSRKIDPSGPSKWAPYGGKWAMDALRRDVDDALGATKPQPPTPSKDTDMIALDATFTEPDTVLTWDGLFLAWVENGHANEVLVNAGVQRQTVNRDQLNGVIAASRTTTRVPYTLDSTLAAAWDARKL